MHSYQLGQANVHFGERPSVIGGSGRTLRSRNHLLAGTNPVTCSSLRNAQGGVEDRLEVLEADVLKVRFPSGLTEDFHWGLSLILHGLVQVAHYAPCLIPCTSES